MRPKNTKALFPGTISEALSTAAFSFGCLLWIAGLPLASQAQAPFGPVTTTQSVPPSTTATPVASGSASVATPGSGASSTSGKTAVKTQFNTQINEKDEESHANFKATVKLVRTITDDETQVFFQEKEGMFALGMRNPNAGKYSQILVKSMKSKKAVKVDWDTYNHQILKVQEVDE